MGSPKALLTYNGKTFVETICANMRAAGIYDITVVLGRHSEEIQKNWPGCCERVVVNPKPEEGQISSLKIALANMPSYAKAAVMALVDQPMVNDSVYKDLIDAWQKNPGAIIIPRHKGKRGHPIMIDDAAWPLCKQAPNDKGLHWVIHHETAKVLDIDVNDESVIMDIDTPQQYQALTGAHK
jgi:CTP:molybdopterin cytidylyltransferase MocA